MQMGLGITLSTKRQSMSSGNASRAGSLHQPFFR
jgi:hypothetical protein